jgi:hypothetical protein
MVKNEAMKAHKDYLESSTFWQFVGYPSALSNQAAQTVKRSIGGLNCYTFNHYVHFNDTMGFWPSFDRAKWRTIPEHTLRFGDMVGMNNHNAPEGRFDDSQHFMMHLGEGLVLAKLGGSEDFIITDLDNGLGLYRQGADDNPEVTAYRAR